MPKIYDPLRKKNVPLTPEEKVRQWFIRYLNTQLGIPLERMGSEVGMKWGEQVQGFGESKRKEYRADIVVWGKGALPVMIVECKREEVELDEEVIRQAMRYDMVLGVKYLVVTNGRRTLMFRKDESVFTPLVTAPSWEEIRLGKEAEK